MNDIAEYLREKYGKWGWLGQRAHDAHGINSVLPLDFIISCDYGTDVPYYFREQDVFSVEKKENTRRDWSNEHLKDSLSGSLGRDILKRWDDYAEDINLICYRSLRKLEKARGALRKKLVIYAVPESLKRHFDNKIHLCRNLPGLSLPLIPWKVGQLGKVTFSELRGDLRLPFVVQFPYGSSGNSTFIIREKKEFDELSRKYPGHRVSIRKYIDGFSLNVNAVVVSAENGPLTFCSFPSIQLVGIRECSNSPASFCGNDFALARDLDKGLIGQVEHSVKTLGAWMAGSGFRGIFGVDFVVGDGTVYPVEIKPRFQNSTSLYTVLEGSGRPRKGSFFLLHVAEFLQRRDKLMLKYIRDFPARELMRPLKGSQIVLHNGTDRGIVTGNLTPGVYRQEDGDMKPVRESASLIDCGGPGDILVTCAVPKPFTVIDPDAPVCKIQMRNNAMDPADRRKLTREARKVVSWAYDKLSLKNVKEAALPGAAR